MLVPVAAQIERRQPPVSFGGFPREQIVDLLRKFMDCTRFVLAETKGRRFDAGAEIASVARASYIVAFDVIPVHHVIKVSKVVHADHGVAPILGAAGKGEIPTMSVCLAPFVTHRRWR